MDTVGQPDISHPSESPVVPVFQGDAGNWQYSSANDVHRSTQQDIVAQGNATLNALGLGGFQVVDQAGLSLSGPVEPAKETSVPSPQQSAPAADSVPPPPEPGMPAAQPAQPHANIFDPAIQSNADTTDPISPPGLGHEHTPDLEDTALWLLTEGTIGEPYNPPNGGSGDTDPTQTSRKLVSQSTTDGVTTTKYSGDYQYGYPFYPFTADEQTDANNNLLSSDIKFDTSYGAPAFDFPKPGGGTQEIRVAEMATTFDSKTGNYDTVITDFNGGQWTAVTAPDGKVQSLTQSKQDPETSVFPTFVPL